MNASLIRIVIADDHEPLRKTWRLLLEQDERLKVVAECSDGREAINACKLLKPDIILIDINMSPVNGFEAAKKISKDAPGSKIIAMSINNQAAYMRKMFDSGAKGYITKSSTKEEMIRAIITVMDGGEYVCEEMRSH